MVGFEDKKERFLKAINPLFIWKQMKNMKHQKLQNSQYLVKKGKSQNFGLNQIKKPMRFFFRREKHGYIIFDSLNFNIFFINKTAKEILSLFDSGLSKKRIIKHISKKYKISSKKASKGVDKILGEIG